MRLSLLLPCVVVAGMIGVSVFAQTGEESVEPKSTSSLFEDFSQHVDEVADHEHLDAHAHDDHTHEAAEEGAEQSVTVEEQKLRQQYLELIEQKSAHMDRSALRKAISLAESDINELKADEMLQQAKQQLLDLVKTHPETSAARAARAMLQADSQTRTPARGFSLPQTYDPGDENATFSPPSGEILPPSTIFEQPVAPFYDPGAGGKQEVPVKPRPRKKGQGDDPFGSPFGNPPQDAEPLDG